MKYYITIFFFLLFYQFHTQVTNKNNIQNNVSTKSEVEEAEEANQQEAMQPVNQAASLKKTYERTRRSYISKYNKSISKNEQVELDKIVAETKTIAPDSYEYHYLAYINSTDKKSDFNHLKKAYEIYPDNMELVDEFIAYYEITDNQVEKRNFLIKLDQSNTIPQEIMSYNKNVLSGLEQNAILITNGFDDTYPIWILQEVKGFRKDVQVINLDLIQEKSYQKQTLKELHLYPLAKTDPVSIAEDLAKKNPNSPINLALTITPTALTDLASKLYLVGLTLKYSDQPIDNVQIISNNWEYKYKKEELYKAVSNRKGRLINANYILPLAVLYNEYKSKNEDKKAADIKSLMLKLAKEAGKEKLVEAYFNG